MTARLRGSEPMESFSVAFRESYPAAPMNERALARVLPGLLPLVLALATPSCVACFDPVEEKFPEDAYETYTGSEERVGDFQVRVTEMSDAAGHTVVLFPMIHIGDAAFYKEVQAECDKADVVLTEGVGGDANLSATHAFTSYLFANYARFAAHGGMTEQHEAFGWRKNQRRGDMTRAEFSDQMPWWAPISQTVLLPFAIVGLEIWNMSNWIGRMSHLAVGQQTSFHEWDRHLFCRIIGESDEEEDEDDLDLLLPGVLEARNAHLVARLDETLKDTNVKRVALPWGAAHMPGVEKSLKERGYSIGTKRWVKAMRVRSFEADGQDEDRATDFMIPWVIHWRGYGGSSSLALLLQTISWDKTESGSWSFDLLWSWLVSTGAGANGEASFQILPSLFDHPILYAWSTDGTSSRHRFLLFFDIGAAD